MKQHRASNEPSQRQLRVGEQIKHIIAESLQRGDVHHPDLMDASSVIVSEVRASPDLKNATAYVNVLGGQNLDVVLDALNDCAKYFQKAVNRGSNLKFTPRIHFKTDESFGEAARIEELLRDIHTNTNIDEPKEDED